MRRVAARTNCRDGQGASQQLAPRAPSVEPVELDSTAITKLAIWHAVCNPLDGSGTLRPHWRESAMGPVMRSLPVVVILVACVCSFRCGAEPPPETELAAEGKADDHPSHDYDVTGCCIERSSPGSAEWRRNNKAKRTCVAASNSQDARDRPTDCPPVNDRASPRGGYVCWNVGCTFFPAGSNG